MLQNFLPQDFGNLSNKLNNSKMSVDVEIYISNFKNFFKTNPNDLLSLVPKEMEEEFYDKVKVASTENVKRGDDPQLTQKQIIDICVEINRRPSEDVRIDEEISENYIIGTKYGPII
jgi:hypothetical protein